MAVETPIREEDLTEYCVQCGEYGHPEEMEICEKCGEQIHEGCMEAHIEEDQCDSESEDEDEKNS